MSYDVGDTAVLAVNTYDAATPPVLADVGAMVATVTLPDGTTTAPSIEHVVSSGYYLVRYTTVQAGRHLIRWVGTGANASTHSEAFDVRPANPDYLVSLRDAKLKCKIPLDDTALDDELRGYMEAATGVVERHLCRTIARRTVVDTVRTSSGSRSLVLPSTPVISVTSVEAIDGSSTWDVANLHINSNAGIVTAVNGGWFSGVLTVTYVAGMAVVPAHYVKAALIIIEHLWHTERGVSEAGERYLMPDTVDQWRGSGFAIPNRALELLGKPSPLVG